MLGYYTDVATGLLLLTHRYYDTAMARLTENVITITLDAALSGTDLSRIRLFRLDLEGAELSALHGSCNLLASVQPDLLFEAEPGHLARQ